MNVDVIGGGPGGAYASLLLKKAHPEWEVTVYERYPPATTYGWAIVLPEKTYAALRAADEPSCERIVEATVRWDPIDSIHRGERTRCGGHPYTSVMRNELLEIIQDRCRDVGVDFQFETEADPLDRARESDLLIGADGLGSATREAFSETFGSTLIEREDRYSWFGTDRQFDALTHIYEENGHGVWHGAAYPARTVSTFAISADEETWRNAGIGDATEEEYISYLEDVFSDHLGGHGLRSKEDRWRHFLTVKNDRWYHEEPDVVLLGDAAHTAHFTIGSGTRMAMDDAIALAESLDRHSGETATALEGYQARRKPHVEALQGAAELSVTHFENLPRYVDLDPERLAFLYLTRTGSNSYDVLRERDPSFIERINRWFAARSGGDPDLDPAGQPLALRDVKLSNRVVTSIPAAEWASDGTPADAYRRYVGDGARDGAGLVVTDPVAVSPDGRSTPGTAGLYADSHVHAWAEAVERAHDAGRHIGARLTHAGRLGAAEPDVGPPSRPLPDREAWGLLGPSPVPYDDHWPEPKEMDEGDMDTVREAFAAAAWRADAAGFDLISVDAGGGSLLGSFISPLSNRRNDAYGGEVRSRLRFPTAVVEAVREVWPEGKPLSVTISATDWTPGGTEIEDAFAAARAFDDGGSDLIEVTAGGTVPYEDPVTDTAWTRLYSHWIRNEVEIPTASTAYLTTRDDVNTMVAGGRADLCYVYQDAGADARL